MIDSETNFLLLNLISLVALMFEIYVMLPEITNIKKYLTLLPKIKKNHFTI